MKTPSGRTSFIHGGSNMMFVAESYIIAVVNGVIALGFIMMADAPKDPTNLNSKCKFSLQLLHVNGKRLCKYCLNRLNRDFVMLRHNSS